MDDLRLKFYQPVVTGTPNLGQPGAAKPAERGGEAGKTSAFQELLQQQIQQAGGIAFSKHAVKRAAEHNIALSQQDLDRLNEGVRLAEQKNLGDTLILVDSTAFLVNVKNNTVITTVDSSKMKGNVFTNIDGTVII